MQLYKFILKSEKSPQNTFKIPLRNEIDDYGYKIYNYEENEIDRRLKEEAPNVDTKEEIWEDMKVIYYILEVAGLSNEHYAFPRIRTSWRNSRCQSLTFFEE